MSRGRFLIVNGDDFGQSTGINRGVVAARERGILTSASLMVRWPGAFEAAQYAREHPALSVGLHLDFGEWMVRGREWFRLYSVVEESNPAALEREILAQLAAFRKLLGRDPTHIDSHQHVHRSEPARSIVSAIADKLGVPVRDGDPRVLYCGCFYGQGRDGVSWPDGITFEALAGILRGLEPGFTELGCHPAAEADVDTMYRDERLQELTTLCDPRTRATIEGLGIELCSFGSLR